MERLAQQNFTKRDIREVWFPQGCNSWSEPSVDKNHPVVVSGDSKDHSASYSLRTCVEREILLWKTIFHRLASSPPGSPQGWRKAWWIWCDRNKSLWSGTFLLTTKQDKHFLRGLMESDFFFLRIKNFGKAQSKILGGKKSHFWTKFPMKSRISLND